MKKRLTLTVDEDVYNAMMTLPRRINISGIVNDLIRHIVDEFNNGKRVKEIKDIGFEYD